MKNEIEVPWGRITRWNLIFHLHYLVRFVSLDIWISSRQCGAPFEELKFGETPLSVLKEILKRVELDQDSVVYDLGCGRGRVAFLLHFLTGAKVIGLDLIGSFLLTGRRIARWVGVESKVLFCYGDIREARMEDADLVYICAACMGRETRQALAENVAACKAGTKVVTVGWKPAHPRLTALEEFETSFSWGRAGVYFSEVASDQDLTIRPSESTTN